MGGRDTQQSSNPEVGADLERRGDPNIQTEPEVFPTFGFVAAAIAILGVPGSIYYLAWNFAFPKLPLGRILWRVTCVVSTFIPILFAGLAVGFVVVLTVVLILAGAAFLLAYGTLSILSWLFGTSRQGTPGIEPMNRSEESKNQLEEVKDQSEEMKDQSKELKNQPSEEIKDQSEEMKDQSKEKPKDQPEELKHRSKDGQESKLQLEESTSEALKNQSDRVNQGQELTNQAEELGNSVGRQSGHWVKKVGKVMRSIVKGFVIMLVSLIGLAYTVCYFGSRLILVSLALWSLHDLPTDAHQTVAWSRYVPHF